MTTLNDEILRVTGGPTLNDGLMSFFGGSGSLNDRARQWLQSQGATLGPVNDMWMQFLSATPGALNDRQLAWWTAQPSFTPPANLLANSALAGMSGSVSGANWVPPTGWIQNNWTLTDAVANAGGAGRLRIVTANQRGYLIQTFDLSAHIGKQLNISCYVEDIAVFSAQRLVHVTGAGITEVRNGSGSRPVGFTGRVDAVYNIDSPAGATQVRLGAGTTANGTQDFTVSRPQLTIGGRLWPYQPT